MALYKLQLPRRRWLKAMVAFAIFFFLAVYAVQYDSLTRVDSNIHAMRRGHVPIPTVGEYRSDTRLM